MAKLFVSYSRKDTPAAKKVVQAFQEMENDIWVDWEDISPAADWMEQIQRGIEGVEAFLFLVSPDSIASEVCKVEVNHAAKNNKRIIPIVVRQVEPKDTIEIIRNLNWIFMRTNDKFEDAIDKVKTAINLDFDWVEEHNRLQTRALEWHRKKENSLLLRGADLWEARRSLSGAEITKKDPQPSDLQKTYVLFSRRNERRNWFIRGLAVVIILVLAFLSYTSVTQRNEAVKNKAIAEENEKKANAAAAEADLNAKEADANAIKAQNNAKKAIREKQSAEKAKQQAEESRIQASAQRSAARAQIYQFRPGELYTSTLLAIASWQTDHSAEAEEILRANISLLPIPVRQMTHAGRINSLEFNTAGDRFVTSGSDGTICVWQVADGESVFCIDSPGGVNDAVFSPTENIIVSGDNAGVVQIINVDNKNIEKQFNFDLAIRDVDVRYDGKYASITTEAGVVTVLDLKARARAAIDLLSTDINFSTFSPRGLQIATGSGNGIISLWELASVSKPFETRKHKGAIVTATFSPNGRYLLTGGADGAVVVFDTRTNTEIYRRQHNDQINDIAFNSDGSWFVTVSSDRNIRMWDTGTGAQLLGMSQNNVVQKVQISKDNRWIATTGDDKTVRVWSTINGAQLFQIPLKGKGTTLGLAKDGKNLIAGDQLGNIYIWDISSIPTPVESLQFNGLTASAVYSPSGNRVAVSDDRRIWLLNPSSLSPLITKPAGSPYNELLDKITQIVFGANSGRIGALTSANNVVIYNLQTSNGKTITPNHPARAFVFSLDERQIIIGDSAGGLEVWDAVSGQFIDTPVSFKQRIVAMAASANYLAVGTGSEVYILDINTLKQITQLKSINDHERLTFSPDGSWLAASSSTDPLQLWEQKDGTFSEPTVFDQENVASIAFYPQGNILAVGAVDNVYLIDPVTLTELARIPHTGTITSVSFSPDGTTLMTASLKVLQFWNLSKIPTIKEENLVDTACGRVIENFNEAQWSLLFETEDYTLLCPYLPVAP